VVTVPLGAVGVATVQAWIADPTANHGLMLQSDTFLDGLDFHAREAATATDRPRLVIDLQ
jgi:hypothetical protein